jgi:4,5:9,10-diseco-3-hydroxy-5,9,17-trioxoandrosta-1(10),2-diene-4-oate hydrolase
MRTAADLQTTIDSIQTRYWAVGQTGSPVVLVHGIGASVEEFATCLEALAAEHRVFALDLPGHGRTDKPKKFSYRLLDMAGFVEKFIQKMNLGKVHLVGHSMGGAVSLSLTLQYPGRVNRLVLVSSAGLGREVASVFRVTSLPLVGELLTRPQPPNRAIWTEVVYDTAVISDADLQTDYQHRLLPGAQRAFLKTVRRNVNFFGQRKAMIQPILAGLGTIQSPTLLVWGREDGIVPVSQAERAVKQIPHARLQVFEQCKHAPILEKPEDFNRLAVDFLRDE